MERKISCVCACVQVGLCGRYTLSVFVCMCVVVGPSLLAGSQCCVITWLSATEPHWSRDRSGTGPYTT